MATEIVLNLADRMAFMFKDNKNKLIDNIIEMVFSQMVEI